MHNCSKGWNPLLGSCGANSKLSGSSGVGKLGEEMKGGNVVNRSHRSTIESLYAWEKKLHKEVKVLLYLMLNRTVCSLVWFVQPEIASLSLDDEEEVKIGL